MYIYTGTELSSCMDVTFNATEAASQRPDLAKNWPSFDYYSAAEATWTREVETHGSCAICQDEKLSDGNSYVGRVLALYKAYNISWYFGKANISQSYDAPVSLQSLRGAFNGTDLEDKVEFVCEGKRNNLDVLQQVRLCLDSTKLSVLECPTNASSTCHTEDIWYLGNSALTGVPSLMLTLLAVVGAMLVVSNH